MNQHPLGQTGLFVSEIGLGTWAFAATAYGDSSHDDAHSTIHAALDGGVTLFDTAPLYGNETTDGIAETLLGHALGARRHNVLIATKFGRNAQESGRATFTGQRARASVEASLQRLGTYWLDILFFHSPFSAEEIADDVWETLGQLKAEGKVRVIGHSISAFAATQEMARQWAAERQIGVVQVMYSLLNREAQPLIRDLVVGGIGVVAREVLANGFLSGTITPETTFPPNHINARYTRAELAERIARVDQYRFLVRGDIHNLPQAALRWVLDEGAVSAVLSGAKTPAELADALAAADAASFTPDEQIQTVTTHTHDFAAA